MRLLQVDTLEPSDFLRDRIPRYAILSHRWGVEEITFQDIRRKNGDDVEKEGFKKVKSFAEYVKKALPHIEWIWVDTCCINQENAAEQTEAINSMYEWYRGAEVCIAYLAGVEKTEDLDQFKRDEWFKRGWTLQELIAPRTVVFLTRTWVVIGHKGKTGRCSSGIDLESGPALTSTIEAVTGIPRLVLDDFQQSESFNVHERLQWAIERQTTREEDKSYCLLGIFGVNMPAIYGERGENARRRLLEAIHGKSKSHKQQYLSTRVVRKNTDEYREIVNWLSPPDPRTNHASARHNHEAQTGTWLIESSQYQNWKHSSSDEAHLWLSGKAGCGKTVLCSSVIEDIRAMCDETTDSAYAMFYFSFSDVRKQSCDDLLRSLVAQLGYVEPAVSRLSQASKNPTSSFLSPQELEEILFLAVESYSNVFFLLDALDECPESGSGDARGEVLRFLERFVGRASNTRLFVTSRETLAIQDSMDSLAAGRVFASSRQVDRDIHKYVATQISRNSRLRRLSEELKKFVAEELSQKADGMFRWASCQLQELQKLKSTKPKRVKAALSNLPSGLDETYERIIVGIGEDYRDEALTLLRWLAYARSPPSLGELAEATVINLENDVVETDERGSLEDTLDILAGLVTMSDEDRDDDILAARLAKMIDEYRDGSDQNNEDKIGSDSSAIWEDITNDYSDNNDFDLSGLHSMRTYRKRVKSATTIRLAHYSVKEYLESDRIARSEVAAFRLEPAVGNRFLAQSCLAYLMHYSKSPQKRAEEKDLKTFPLLRYAARTWFYHSSLQQAGSLRREMALLCSEEAKCDWLLVYRPDLPGVRPFEEPLGDVGSALYYASSIGLLAAVNELLTAGQDVNAQGGSAGSALQEASVRGHERIVEILIDSGADVNARGRSLRPTALQAASENCHEKIVKMLLDSTADVNAEGWGIAGTALQVASLTGHEKIVKMLIDSGADVNAEGTHMIGTALQEASLWGHEKIVKMLLDSGADVNARGGDGGSALEAARNAGHQGIVEMLMEAGAHALESDADDLH